MDKQLPSPEDRITVKSATADKAMRLSEAKPRPEQEAMRSVGRKLAQLREARRWKMEDLPGTPLELPGSDGVKLPRRHRSWTARYGLWGGAGACVLLLVAWLFRQY